MFMFRLKTKQGSIRSLHVQHAPALQVTTIMPHGCVISEIWKTENANKLLHLIDKLLMLQICTSQNHLLHTKLCPGLCVKHMIAGL